RFAAIVARHRVEGLVHDGLRHAGVAPPPEIAARLAAAATGIARENLLFAAEAHRLNGLLEAAGARFLFLKGITLNMLAYGTLALKKAADIDVAVEPDDYPAAIAAVRAAGYLCVAPGPDPSLEEILAWSERTKHSIWTRGGICLELHTSLVDSGAMLGGVTVSSPRQQVRIAPGISLPTLATDELFAYLVVHGATHAWSRLKWLADVAALLSHLGETEIAPLYRRSLALGAGRSGAQALLLAEQLLGLRIPTSLSEELRRDRGVRYLARAARAAMLRGGGKELDEMMLGTASIHLSHLRLKKGLAFKLHELRRKLRSDGHGETHGSARLLARLLAGPRWLGRRARRAALPR
ncbi:MAG: hypothetical protein JWO81_1110, partial [Alphaproteobacteria bacterium]|nr:hypothetical protein [Alphaproteobacteria bacterium]